MYELLAIPLGVSLILNAYQYRRRSKKPPREEAYEATQLLNDLTSGSALVKVSRVDPSTVFIRSVRNLD